MPDDTEELFKKYRRGDDVSGVGGAGVGLWLVREIANQHGGTVQLHYRPEGIVTARLSIPYISHKNKCMDL